MTKPAKKVQYKNYSDYLKSPKWEKVKESYKSYAQDLNIEFDLCYFCKADKNIQLHHWKYVKDWNDDNCTNLIQVCAGCHTKLHNQLRHNLTMYTTKEEYLSDAASLLISVAHLEGFAEGEGIQEKERTDESNAFIDHSNDEIEMIGFLSLSRNNDALMSVLGSILNAEGVQFKYISFANQIHQKKMRREPAFVEITCDKLRATVLIDKFDKIINSFGEF